MRRFQLLWTPLSFLRLRSPDLTVYQWYLPTSLAVIELITYHWLPVPPSLFGDKGLVDSLNSLFSVLIGFYIAALAAVATFQNIILDELMRGRAPTIRVYRQGAAFDTPLTRRRFLVILFGYCSFLSIALFSFGVASKLAAPSFAGSSLAPTIKVAWLALYLWMASSLLITTILGLHYLIDRMHRE